MGQMVEVVEADALGMGGSQPVELFVVDALVGILIEEIGECSLKDRFSHFKKTLLGIWF